MSHKEYKCTIQIECSEDNYGTDGSTASGALILPAQQFPDGIRIEYNGEYLDEIASNITKDIREFLENPEAWIKDYIAKGPDTWEKLRGLEAEFQEYQRDTSQYLRYADQAKRYAQGKAQQIEVIQAKLEGRTCQE